MARGQSGTDRAPTVRFASSAATRFAPISLLVIGYALLAAFARPLTDPSVAATLVPGAAVAWWGVHRAPIRRIRVTRATVGAWIGLGGLFCAWELVAYYSGNDATHPTFSLLTDPVFATYPGRVAGYAVWLLGGMWLVSR